VGADKRHMKLVLEQSSFRLDAIGFGLGELYPKMKPDEPIDVVYTVDMNVWNGNKKLQLKIKDIHFAS
jgi:single-stranded-DNA-specific exonuclease